jgi:hypothetical protein
MLVLPRGDTTMAEYQADEVACQPYAEAASKGAWNQQYWNSFGQGLMAGVADAAVGASVGSGFGMAGYGAQVGAATGFAHGAMWDTVTPAAASQVADNMAYAQCLRTKGHKLPGLQSIDDQPSRRGGMAENVQRPAENQAPMTQQSSDIRPAPVTQQPHYYRALQCEDPQIRAMSATTHLAGSNYETRWQDGSGLDTTVDALVPSGSNLSLQDHLGLYKSRRIGSHGKQSDVCWSR